MTCVQVAEREWTLGEPLGQGGFGQVFKATCGTDVAAVKVVAKAPGADRELLLANVEGASNVLPILGTGEDGDSWFLLMPLADGNLRDRIEGGSLSFDEVVAILVNITSALADLDGEIVHRDLKPENVLHLEDRWCLADFGISRYAEAATATDTRKGFLSEPYAAPERWRFERATIGSDVYSVGVIAFELVQGRRPFVGPTSGDFRIQHLEHDPPRLTGFGAAFASLVDECLSKAPEARPRPANLLKRLAGVQVQPASRGLSRLREANHDVVQQRSEHARRESVERSASERLVCRQADPSMNSMLVTSAQ